jgi:hypothetical protein
MLPIVHVTSIGSVNRQVGVDGFLSPALEDDSRCAWRVLAAVVKAG